MPTAPSPSEPVRAQHVRPQPLGVLVPELPANATGDMRAVAADMAKRMGERLAVGDHRPLPYAASVAAEAIGPDANRMRGWRAIRRLVEAGVIETAGELGARRQPRGTQLYAVATRTLPGGASDGEAGIGAGVVEAVEPLAEVPQKSLMADAELAVGSLNRLAAAEGSTQGQRAVGHAAHTNSDDGGYVGGPCPDPLRCRHWKRHPNGPWTCAFNHPRIGALA